MADLSSTIPGRLEAEFREVLEAAGAREEATIKASLGTDAPPASKPGEVPHRRTGELQAGIGHAVGGDIDAGLDLEMTCSATHGKYLEPSRPFMAPALDRLKASLVGELADRIRATFT